MYGALENTELWQDDVSYLHTTEQMQGQHKVHCKALSSLIPLSRRYSLPKFMHHMMNNSG